MRKILFVFLILMTSCVFDSGVEWKDGPYELLWIDDPSRMMLSHRLSDSTSYVLVDYCVFSVGSDERYLVVKQHPDGDKNKINYFYVDRKADSAKKETNTYVFGPFDFPEFESKRRDLMLPQFSKVLNSLE